jgi:signal transduction histidine kinase
MSVVEPVIIQPDLIERLSHEMRTSLTGIVGYAEFIEEGSEPAMVNFTAKIIRESSQDLVRTVQSFVDFYQTEWTEPAKQCSEFSPAQIIHALIRANQLQADQLSLSLIFNCTDEGQLVTMNSNPEQFHKLLQALISGALLAATRGAMVVVALRVLAKNKCIEVLIHELGGIAKLRQSRLMQQFWNESHYVFKMQEGPGIDMALAKSLVSRLKGRASFQSVKGEGDQLRLVLPINLN